MSTKKPQQDAAAPLDMKNYFKEIKKQAQKSKATTEKPSARRESAISIDDKIKQEKARKERIANDIAEKDHLLKEHTLRKLFRFLSVETAVIFGLAFVQGFSINGFKLEEWSFRLIIAATIGQITAMLIIAVQHLFPDKK